MKSLILIVSVVLLSTTFCQAQIKNAKTETVKVFGNCDMCATTIEKAANKSKISKADWNEETKMATITYDSKKTNIDAVLKNIALAGYDSEKFLAPDAAYNKLPGCCKYERIGKTLATIDHIKKEDEKMEANKMIDEKINQTKSDAKKDDHAQHNMEKNNKNEPNTLQEINQLTAVFDKYFSLKDALIKSVGNVVSAKASGLQMAIKSVKMDKLPMNVHTVWMQVLKDVNADVALINGTKDIAIQRKNFMSLSKNMFNLIKVAKPAQTVYYQFCPMANGGKGANWLSKETTIKNPYYGNMMLTCGNTVETIK